MEFEHYINQKIKEKHGPLLDKIEMQRICAYLRIGLQIKP